MAANVRLRDATRDDIALLERWDRDPTVLSAHSDTAEVPDSDWPEEFDIIDRYGTDVWQNLIATLEPTARDGTDVEDASGTGRAIGVVRIMDPTHEPSRYWHPVEDNVRALDIWIGEPDARGLGYGSVMMMAALDRCFADRAVEAVVIDPLASNERAHRFYERLGFAVVGPRRFGADECLVMRIDRISWHTVA